MDLPAFRLLYSEENVANDPINRPRYANGMTRPTQSTMMCSFPKLYRY